MSVPADMTILFVAASELYVSAVNAMIAAFQELDRHHEKVSMLIRQKYGIQRLEELMISVNEMIAAKKPALR